MVADGFGTDFYDYRAGTQCLGVGFCAVIDGFLGHHLEHGFGCISSAKDSKRFVGAREQYVPLDGLGNDAGGHGSFGACGADR